MINKLKRVKGNIFRWKIELRLPTRRVNTHIEATEETAHKMYAELLEERSRARIGLPQTQKADSVTIEHALSAYERHMVASGMSAGHIIAVTRSLNLLRKIIKPELPLSFITSAVINEWMQTFASTKSQKGKLPTGRTVNKGRAHLSACLGWCIRPNNWMQFNPADSVSKYKEVPPPEKNLSFDSYKLFAKAAWEYRPALALLIEVIAETGARINEVCRANACDVDIKRQVWSKIVKGGKRRILVAAGPWTIKAAKDGTAALCPREDGLHFRYTAVLRAFDMICERAKLTRFTPHWLRHARATWDADDGVPVRAVQRQLGHTNINTTQRYFAGAEAKDLLSHKRHKLTKPPVEFVSYSDKAGKGKKGKGTKGQKEKSKYPKKNTNDLGLDNK